MATDRCLPNGLLASLKGVCLRRTYVHAELLLVDYARHPNIEFVGGDKYVGCSKPACHCCYQYIQALSVDYKLTLPACHKKMYLQWRLPDLPYSRGEIEGKTKESTMNKMIESFRADLKSQIDRCGKRTPQFDSTTGVTKLLYDNSTETVVSRKGKILSAHGLDFSQDVASTGCQSANPSDDEHLDTEESHPNKCGSTTHSI